MLLGAYKFTPFIKCSTYLFNLIVDILFLIFRKINLFGTWSMHEANFYSLIVQFFRIHFFYFGDFYKRNWFKNVLSFPNYVRRF